MLSVRLKYSVQAGVVPEGRPFMEEHYSPSVRRVT